MLNNYLKSFKAYDIRGVYEKEIDTKLVYILGRAIGKYFKKNYGLDGKFLIAKDVRPANDVIIPYFIKGFMDIGLTQKNIFYTDLCSTAISYCIGQGDFDLSVNFTASHNPPEYIGMKFFDKNTVFLSQQLLKDIFTSEFNELKNNNFDFQNISLNLGGGKDYRIDTKIIYNITKNEQIQTDQTNDILNKKTSQLFSFLNKKYSQLQKKHKFVVDFSNGSATKYEKDFLRKLQEQGHNISFLNDEPDGTFPNHLSDTQDHENYNQCFENVKKNDAEFGIMFDGDADRIGFVGPDGKIVGGDILLTILAKQCLNQEKNIKKRVFSKILNIFQTKPKIIYEVMCSKSIKEEVEKMGGEAILHKMGRFFIKEKMDEIDAVLGGETSGHFMFKEIGGYEMPLLALFYIMQELENRTDFTTMIANYKKYPKSPVLSKKVENKNKTIENIKKKYSDLHQESIDGVSVFGDTFWFNVRGSNTENKVRYTVEADTKEIMQQELEKLEKILD